MATVITVACAAAVAQGFGRFTYGVILPDVRDDLLGGSNSLAGFLGTANTAMYLLGALLVGSLSARVTPVGSVRIGILLSLSGIGVASIAPNAVVLTIALMLMGLGGAAIWIPSPGLAVSVVPERLKGLAVGMTGSGVGLGIVFSGRLNAILTSNDQTASDVDSAIGIDSAIASDGWREVYAVQFVLGLVVAVAVFVVLRNRSQQAPRGGVGGFAVLRTVEGWRPLTACYVTYGFGYLLVIAFLVARLTDDSRLSRDDASTVFSLLGACTIFVGVLVGRISDSLGRRRTLIVGFPLWAVGVGLILTGTGPLVVIGAVLIGILFGGLPSVIAAYLIDRTDPAAYGPAYAAATFAFGQRASLTHRSVAVDLDCHCLEHGRADADLHEVETIGPAAGRTYGGAMTHGRGRSVPHALELDHPRSRVARGVHELEHHVAVAVAAGVDQADLVGAHLCDRIVAVDGDNALGDGGTITLYRDDVGIVWPTRDREPPPVACANRCLPWTQAGELDPVDRVSTRGVDDVGVDSTVARKARRHVIDLWRTRWRLKHHGGLRRRG